MEQGKLALKTCLRRRSLFSILLVRPRALLQRLNKRTELSAENNSSVVEQSMRTLANQAPTLAVNPGKHVAAAKATGFRRPRAKAHVKPS